MFFYYFHLCNVSIIACLSEVYSSSNNRPNFINFFNSASCRLHLDLLSFTLAGLSPTLPATVGAEGVFQVSTDASSCDIGSLLLAGYFGVTPCTHKH